MRKAVMVRKYKLDLEDVERKKEEMLKEHKKKRIEDKIA